MSTVKVTNLRHENATSNNIALDSSNNVTTANNFTAGGTIGCTGNLTVTSGNVVLSSGNGIDFSATNDAGGMTSELLDDYEEGSWTPTILGTTSDPTVSYTYQVGEYIKVGNKVTVWLFVKIASTSGGGGDINIGSLPYTVSSDVGKAEASTFAVNYYTNTGFSSGQIPSGYGRRNDDKIYFSKLGTGTSATGVATSTLGSNWAVYGSMNYYVD